MAASRVTLVTGANRGIGFSILQALAQRSPFDQYLLGARNLAAGEKAVIQLRELGITARIDVIALDVTSDESIRAAEGNIRLKFGKLDVLVNNAAQVFRPDPDNSNLRSSYNRTLDTNVTSIASIMTTFIPLMKASSSSPRIINISSARGSLTLASSGSMPPTQVIAYNVSKAALNMLSVEYAKAEPEVQIYSACPGFCNTAFNGWKGTKDPLDGAKVIVELVLAAEGIYEGGFWHMEGEDTQPRRIAW